MNLLRLTSSILIISSSALYGDELELAGEPGISNSELAAILNDPRLSSIASTRSLALDEAEVDGAALKARSAKSTLGTSVLDNVESEVIIQVGHFPRTKGKTGGQGAYVSEQEVAAYIASLMGEYLSDYKVDFRIIAADNFGNGGRAKIFIALHTDSTIPENACQLGPSVGYGEASNALGMHLIAFAVASTFDYDVNRFMSDNYTRNLSGYYAYSMIKSSIFEGVIEMGELTCPESEVEMLTRADALAKSMSVAISIALGKQN
jgi:hypothetical protein